MVAAVLVMRLTSAVPIGTTVVFSGLLVACGWMREYGNDLILFKKTKDNFKLKFVEEKKKNSGTTRMNGKVTKIRLPEGFRGTHFDCIDNLLGLSSWI